MTAQMYRPHVGASDAATLVTAVPNHDRSDMSVSFFVKSRFIPNHVQLKKPAGQTHYHAILKHILMPETVDPLFAAYGRIAKGRLKAVPAWPYLDDVRLCDLTSEHVRRLTRSAEIHGYSPQTVKHIRNVVGAIVSHARKELLFSGDDPVASVELPRMQRRESPTFSIAQAKRLIRGLEYPEREIALLMLGTGMNIWEVCALQWKDVNLTATDRRVEGKPIPARSILIRRQWSTEGGFRQSDARTRVIPIAPTLIEVLSKLQSEHGSQRACFVIVNGDGGPLNPINKRPPALQTIGRQLDLPWVSWEVLRRAHSTMLLELRIRLTEELVIATARS